jgi:hypothetical protein
MADIQQHDMLAIQFTYGALIPTLQLQPLEDLYLGPQATILYLLG